MLGDQKTKFNWALLILFWAIIACAVSLRTVFNADTIPLFSDTDDAMRLTVVRDLMAGQGWYDLIQHRLNAPFGASIHWSRLVDVPIATMIALLHPFVGGKAVIVTAYLWPLVLLLILLALTAKLSIKLVGPEAFLPGIVLPVLSVALLPEFMPGRVDHHNVQAILSVAIVLTTIIAWEKPRWSIGAGILAATALAIGTESLPFVAGAILVFGLYWVLDPQRATALRGFGLSFSAAALAHLAIALPPAQWLTPACDALSIVYGVAALGTGIVFALLPTLPLATRPWSVRLIVGGISGAALLAVLLILFPQCLGGPYANLDPWLRENWVANIVEARPIWSSIVTLPAVTLALAVPALVALVIVLWRITRDENTNKIEWYVLGLFLSLAIIVMLLQVRGGRLAAPLAVPAGAWLIGAVRQRYLSSKKLIDAGWLVGSWLLFAGVAIGFSADWVVNLGSKGPGVKTEVASDAEPLADKTACLLPAAFEKIAKLPAQPIMTPGDLGAHILLFTHHSVVGAPYHRNANGMFDTLRFFNRPIVEAREILRARGIETVVTCPAMPEVKGYPDAAPDSFVKLVARDELPNWLVDETPSGAVLKTYKVLD